ncbi:MAG TPA: MarR family transcriptional regulator [Verrucomicrobiae bacterium]|jgi:DNA-binding MarR family transcriptional regulator|nr:MarR family transcriptional regulator [Verrucomicrobiae bacterium]
MKQKSARLTRENLGFLLAKAIQNWNEMLYQRFCNHGFRQVRPSFGSILIPLFEKDGLRLGELAERGGISKQTMTSAIRHVENAGLIRRKPDPDDARAVRVYLTAEARRFEPVAERVLADMDCFAEAVAGAPEVKRTIHWLKRYAEACGKNHKSKP